MTKQERDKERLRREKKYDRAVARAERAYEEAVRREAYAKSRLDEIQTRIDAILKNADYRLGQDFDRAQTRRMERIRAADKIMGRMAV